MRIAFLVERPTQFEAPFYRFAAQDPEHELRVLYTAPDVADPVDDPELGRKVSWGIDLLSGYPWEICPARGLQKRLQCDLLIVNGYTRRIYLKAAVLAKRAGVATALRLDSVLWDGSPARDLAKRLFFATWMRGLYDLFLGVGSLTLDYLRAQGIPPERTGLFPYAVDVEDFRSRSALAREERGAFRDRLGVPREARVVLSLAKLGAREAPWDLLHAFSRLGEDVWLVLAGDGPERSALESAAGPRVRFPGYVPYPELPALYAAADLFVHPAREERWGVSVQEALSCGLPVVASSRVGAAFDLVASGENGFTYEAGDREALAACLSRALSLPLDRVRSRSAEILARWDYAASWQGILSAARRLLEVKRS